MVCQSQLPAAQRIMNLVCGLPTPLRQKRLLLMLQGYFDDSGSDGQETSFVLAGYVLPAELWANFSDDWHDECQREPRIDYFKMREAAGGWEQFAGVPIEFRQYKVRKLFALIDKHILHGIATDLKWEEFRQFDSRVAGPAKNVAYGPLFFGILDNVLAYQKHYGLFPHKIQVAFDIQGKAGRVARGAYDKIMELSENYGHTDPQLSVANDLRTIIDGTPRELDDKKYLPLQAADMLAWALRLRMNQSEFEESSFAWLYDEIRKTVWAGSLLSGYKSNRMSCLAEPGKSLRESGAWRACKMGVFSKRVRLKICRIA